jgi:hypothetical protein
MEPNSTSSPASDAVTPAAPGKATGPVKLFSDSWNFYKAHWKILVPIVIFPSLLVIIGQIFGKTGSDSGSVILMVLSALFMLAGFIATIAMQPAAVNTLRTLHSDSSSPVKFWDQYKFGFKWFWWVLLLIIVQGFILLGSTILFLVPGIIVAGYVSMYLFALVLDEKKGFSAFTESYSVIKGRWWGTLGRVLFLGLIYVIASIIVSIIGKILTSPLPPASSLSVSISLVLSLLLSVVFGPLSLVYVFKLYLSLKETRLLNVPTSAFKKWLIAFLVIGIIAIPVILATASILYLRVINQFQPTPESFVFRNMDQVVPSNIQGLNGQ